MKNLTLLLVFCFTISVSIAKDFGQHGIVYKIKEESFIAMIKRRLSKVDLKIYEDKVKERVKHKVNNPSPVRNIVKANNTREFYYNPTYVVKEDIILPCNKILYKAGTMVNPLEHMNLDKVLYFIDARDEEQVTWLQEELAKNAAVESDSNNNLNSNIESKIILTGGNVFELKKQLQMPVYFDQMGAITGKFGIKHVPAKAVQDGLVIKIKEIALDDVTSDEEG